MRYLTIKLCFFLTMGFLILLFSCSSTTVFANDAILSWDPNTEPDLAGYKVYYGTASGNYGTPINVGNQTTYTVTGLGIATYYFAVTACDTSGYESAFSNEVSKAITTTTSGGGGNRGVVSGGGGCGRIKDISSGSGQRHGQIALDLAVLALPLILMRMCGDS